MEKNSLTAHRLIIVSNRLPFEIEKKDGQYISHPGSGGLVTALAPVLKNRGGLWIGWPGGIGIQEADLKTLIAEAGSKTGFAFVPVPLTQEQLDSYYFGFSNEIIWPLFHDLQTLCHFVPNYWRSYQEVNEKFATVLSSSAGAEDFIWVHDYHLMLVAQALRLKGIQSKMGFFLHIPFPPLDIFLKLPWRFELLQALLEYDLIGFQTARDCRNFIQCVRYLKLDIPIKTLKGLHVGSYHQREIRIGNFPISIDFQEFSNHATTKEISEAAWLLHENWKEQKLILSVDRLDYTKGIPYRLEAIRLFLQQHPEFHKKVSFVQVIIPSRTDIPGYQTLKQEIDRLVGEINSQFTFENWVPIQHIFHSLSREELLAYYRTADIAFVTSLKDGMNLVAKEYVASQVDKTGVLILSEFAGTAVQLRHGALMIHPYDSENMAKTIHHALVMDLQERRKRMELMRRVVKRQDIYWWLKMFMKAAFARTLDDFPEIESQENIAELTPPNML